METKDIDRDDGYWAINFANIPREPEPYGLSPNYGIMNEVIFRTKEEAWKEMLNIVDTKKSTICKEDIRLLSADKETLEAIIETNDMTYFYQMQYIHLNKSDN